MEFPTALVWLLLQITLSWQQQDVNIPNTSNGRNVNDLKELQKSGKKTSIDFLNELMKKKKGNQQLCWSKWISKYFGSEGLDDELFTPTDHFMYRICDKPLAIDVSRVDGKSVVAKLSCSFNGCICKDSEQQKGITCQDYQVRFLCPCKGKTTVGSKLLCHMGKREHIQCPPTKRIHILSAFYGVIWMSKCGVGPAQPKCTTNSDVVTRMIQQDCSGKSRCRINPPPLDDYDAPECFTEKRHLHVAYECTGDCIFKGLKYNIGDSFVDPMCRYRCECLRDGRYICSPLCPPAYGVPCSGIVRIHTVPAKLAPQCRCAKPVCQSNAQQQQQKLGK